MENGERRDPETRELCLSSSKFLDFKVCRIFVSRRQEGKKNVQFDHSSPVSLKSRVLKQKRMLVVFEESVFCFKPQDLRNEKKEESWQKER